MSWYKRIEKDPFESFDQPLEQSFYQTSTLTKDSKQTTMQFFVTEKLYAG